jgi:type I restriction enzyme S subunit
MVNGNLPDGWEWKKIADIADTTSGGTPLRSHPEYYGGKIPWAKSGELRDGIIREVEETITEAGLKNSSAKLFSKDTVVVALYGATVGRTGILGIDATSNQAVCGIFPRNNSFVSKYMFYWLQSQRQYLISQSAGGAQPNISQGIIRSLDFPLAPFPEQERIVAKIEELFTQLEAGAAALERVQAGLKRYKASVLKAAVEGKLLENREIENSGELPEGWKWATVEELAKVGTGSTPLRSKEKYWKNGTIPWVTSGALNDLQVFHANEFVTDIALKETNVKIFPAGTLLIAMYGEGKTRGKVSELMIDATTNQACAALVFDKKQEAYKPYIKIFFQKYYEDIRFLSSGGVQPNLNLSIIKNTRLPLPPLEEQRRIVAEVERRLSLAAGVESTLAVSMSRAGRLRQSVLKSAFEGRLVS